MQGVRSIDIGHFAVGICRRTDGERRPGRQTAFYGVAYGVLTCILPRDFHICGIGDGIGILRRISHRDGFSQGIARFIRHGIAVLIHQRCIQHIGILSGERVGRYRVKMRSNDGGQRT